MTPAAPPSSFAVRLIAETGDRFSDFVPYVASVNNAGTVAFQAALRTGGSAVFTGSGGEVAKVLDTADPRFNGFISHPDLNDRGALSVYAGLPSSGQGVVLIRDRQPEIIACTGETFKAIGPLGPTMNDEGVVAFRADLATGESGVFAGDARAITAIAETSGRFAAFQGLPVINANGTLMFRADLKDGSKGIFTSRGGALTTIAETGGPFADFASFPSMNDEGTVAFCAVLKSGGAGVFTAREGRLTTVVGAQGGFESFRNALINRSGAVVFAGTPRGGTLGIYAGPDPVADRVLGLGDALFGSTVADFALNPVSVNDVGQLAIRVKLANDRQFILRADPVN
jgi:hypothetical protein